MAEHTEGINSTPEGEIETQNPISALREILLSIENPYSKVPKEVNGIPLLIDEAKILERYGKEIQEQMAQEREIRPQATWEEISALIFPKGITLVEGARPVVLEPLLSKLGVLKEGQTLDSLRAEPGWVEVDNRGRSGGKGELTKNKAGFHTNIPGVTITLREGYNPNPGVGEMNFYGSSVSAVFGPEALKQIAASPIAETTASGK